MEDILPLDESSFLKNLEHSRLGNGPNEYERKYIFDAKEEEGCPHVGE